MSPFPVSRSVSEFAGNVPSLPEPTVGKRDSVVDGDPTASAAERPRQLVRENSLRHVVSRAPTRTEAAYDDSLKRFWEENKDYLSLNLTALTAEIGVMALTTTDPRDRYAFGAMPEPLVDLHKTVSQQIDVQGKLKKLVNDIQFVGLENEYQTQDWEARNAYISDGIYADNMDETDILRLQNALIHLDTASRERRDNFITLFTQGAFRVDGQCGGSPRSRNEESLYYVQWGGDFEKMEFGDLIKAMAAEYMSSTFSTHFANVTRQHGTSELAASFTRLKTAFFSDGHCDLTPLHGKPCHFEANDCVDYITRELQRLWNGSKWSAAVWMKYKIGGVRDIEDAHSAPAVLHDDSPLYQYLAVERNDTLLIDKIQIISKLMEHGIFLETSPPQHSRVVPRYTTQGVWQAVSHNKDMQPLLEVLLKQFEITLDNPADMAKIAGLLIAIPRECLQQPDNPLVQALVWRILKALRNDPLKISSLIAHIGLTESSDPVKRAETDSAPGAALWATVLLGGLQKNLPAQAVETLRRMTGPSSEVAHDGTGCLSLNELITLNDPRIFTILYTTSTLGNIAMTPAAGRQLLHDALSCENPDFGLYILNELLATEGVYPDLEDEEGRTPLWEAIEKECDISLIKRLIEDERIDLQSENRDGHSLLLHAMSTNSVYAVQALLESGRIDPNQAETNSEPPLIEAVMSANPEMVQAFLDTKGINVQLPDSGGRTAADWARKLNDPELMALLQS